MSRKEHDQRRQRCRMLGHEVDFAYCRCGTGPLPCRKVFDCWFEVFDIVAYMRAHYSEAEIATLLEPPAPRLTRIVELIERARQRQTEPGGDDPAPPGRAEGDEGAGHD